jgi:hypothetical protein
MADADAAEEPLHFPDPMLDDLRAAAASVTEYTELITDIPHSKLYPSDVPLRAVHPKSYQTY